MRRIVAIGSAYLSAVLAIALAATAVWAQCWAEESKKSGYPNAELLVDTQEVADHLGDPYVRLVDLRRRGPLGSETYAKGHIPGAVYLNWQELDDLTSNRKGLPMDRVRAEALFSKLGIDEKIRVIAYDDSGGLLASRLFFVLEFFGHQQVAVLNGGLTKWTKEDRPLSTEAPKISPRRFVARPNPKLIATAEWVKDQLKNRGVCLVDARTPMEYQGKAKNPRVKRTGRIPGAVLINWVDTINPEDGTLKSAEELQKMFEQAGATKDREIVTYCEMGVRAAHDYFVARLLGYEKVRNYDGSWIDWGNRPELPVER